MLVVGDPAPTCAPSLYESLPRMDLVGTLIGSAAHPGQLITAASEEACRVECCARAGCTAYSFANGILQMVSVRAESAEGVITVLALCGLYANVTDLVPSTLFSSGAMLSVYS